MTSDRAFVWVWLPEGVEPVVAGRLDDIGDTITFTYGRSYLDRPEAIALYEPELPLFPGVHLPISGRVAGCLADAGPDAWGRRVIEHRRTDESSDLSEIGYLLASGSDRVGALDFQASAENYIPRTGGQADLAQLAEAAELVETGEPLPEALSQALLHGSSVGGARPKAILDDESTGHIAKFGSTTDTFPVVKGEFVAMELARRAGINAARVEVREVMGKDVLLVKRFDRQGDGRRRLIVSAMTILELHDADGMAGRYGSYVDLAVQIRSRFTEADVTLRELFSRISFNILVSNTDDHPRNHAAFWDGHNLTLTPAYDICPQNRTGEVANQAMAYGPKGERSSHMVGLVSQAGHYHLSMEAAHTIIDHQIATIETQWDEVCDLANLTTVDRDRLRGRQFLNPYALYEYMPN